VIISTSSLEEICQLRPYRSVSQPHGPGFPPSTSAAHSRSISSWVSQRTSKETASVNGNCGPPLMPTNRRPSSSNSTVITEPSGPGVFGP
jgi:hypothetical protein